MMCWERKLHKKLNSQNLSFLWQLQRDGVTAAELPKLSRKRLTEYLAFSNRFCAISVQHHGAIDSYPTLEQMEQPETDFPLP